MVIPNASILEGIVWQLQRQSGTTQQSLPKAKGLWVEDQDLSRESSQSRSSEKLARPIFWRPARQSVTRNSENGWPRLDALRDCGWQYRYRKVTKAQALWCLSVLYVPKRPGRNLPAKMTRTDIPNGRIGALIAPLIPRTLSIIFHSGLPSSTVLCCMENECSVEYADVKAVPHLYHRKPKGG